MKTYLLTWNPKSSPKDDEYLREDVRVLSAGQPSPLRWSAGNNQSIRKGDRVFLLKQGAKQPGLMGSGVVTEGSYLDQHRDLAKRRAGIQGWYIKLQWDRLVLPERVLPKAALLERDLLPKNLIRVACSGPAIPEPYATRLEAAWSQLYSTGDGVGREAPEDLSGSEGARIEYRTYRRERDRQLRQAALNAAKGVCDVCRVDYSKLLGGRGIRVLEVHHRRQLSERDAPQLTSLADLAVVCANCHTLIHIDPKRALSVEKLRELLAAGALAWQAQ